ncbi:TPA: hypothetical protein VBA39_000880 [Streptococcus agalactiae]|nr:hypothetical protein [Streptococcus agalactiae]HEO6628592.1 hypothetical protein [Streptococcus agalactiae]HEO6630592.1 hypothetical protein [Streptococcus agalactiae]HEO6657982.1 hypothetical protein [Streptococcus agalactiae]
MNIDILQIGAASGAILSVIGLWAFVVNPFKTAMQKNEDTMSALKDTIKDLAYELKDSQRDRENIHKVLDIHEQRLGKTEDDIIVNKEQIKTLFNRRMKHD